MESAAHPKQVSDETRAAERLALASDICTALTTDVLNGITGPFQPFLHEVAKPHPGQIRSAADVRTLPDGSGLARPDTRSSVRSALPTAATRPAT